MNFLDKNDMKIRNGFVSNSSSSSFLLLGFKLNDNDIKELINNLDNNEYDKPPYLNQILDKKTFIAYEDGYFGIILHKLGDGDVEVISLVDIRKYQQALKELFPNKIITIISGEFLT